MCFFWQLTLHPPQQASELEQLPPVGVQDLHCFSRSFLPYKSRHLLSGQHSLSSVHAKLLRRQHLLPEQFGVTSVPDTATFNKVILLDIGSDTRKVENTCARRETSTINRHLYWDNHVQSSLFQSAIETLLLTINTLWLCTQNETTGVH